MPGAGSGRSADGAPHPDASAYSGKFVGRYSHRVVEGGIGTTCRREAPAATPPRFSCDCVGERKVLASSTTDL